MALRHGGELPLSEAAGLALSAGLSKSLRFVRPRGGGAGG